MVGMKNRKKALTTPVLVEDLADIHAGDIIYLNDSITICRGVARRRPVEGHRELPVDVRNNATLHVGPIIRPLESDRFEMVFAGSTTSMRMEEFEEEFAGLTEVRVIIGKDGMGPNTEYACENYKTIHCVLPTRNAVITATGVKGIMQTEWGDLGMPGTLRNCRVKGSGPLIVSTDTEGWNLFEENKVAFNGRKEKTIGEICRRVSSIK